MSNTDEQSVFQDAVCDLAQPILRYLERYVGDRFMAEELQQETLIRMSKGFAGFAGRSSLKTWAFSIAGRVAADYFRHPSRRLRIVELDEAAGVTDPDRAIDERLVAEEMNACIRGVIDSLPEVYREALILHDLEGFTLEQAAEISQCTLASVKIRIHRARLRLKEALKTGCTFYNAPDGVFRCDRKE
ncbi:MAG: RNA polymerase sigma factor [Nitrospira sp.]|nr:MAG: RNA polymerase sigma factor [Nitrospira sp.]